MTGSEEDARAGAATAGLELVVLVGLPGAGKTTFYRQRFADSHALVSKDRLRGNRRPARRQAALIAEALAARRSVVVDNTNVIGADRAALVAQGRACGARVVAYVFAATVDECRERNARREGRARVPEAAIFALARRYESPTPAEGFDEMYVVRTRPGLTFEVVRP
jgi:predicted kinase